MKITKLKEPLHLNEVAIYACDNGSFLVKRKSQYDWDKSIYWEGFKTFFHYKSGVAVCNSRFKSEVLDCLSSLKQKPILAVVE